MMEERPSPISSVSAPPRRSIWPRVLLGVLVTSLTVGLLFSLAVNLFLSSTLLSRGEIENLREVELEGSGEEKIALIPVRGVITFQQGRELWDRDSLGKLTRDRLQAAAEDPAVRAVVLLIDSPGGGVTASDILHRQIQDLQASGRVVVAAFEDMAASGGYYIASPADWIVAHPTTVTGSIGVIMQSLNLRGLLDKVGIREVTYKRGEQKDLLSPFRDATEEEQELIQGVVDEIYARFLEVVAEGRGFTSDQLDAVAGGAIFSGKQALANGLVDEVGYRETAISRAQELAGLDEATVIEYRRPQSWLDLVRGRMNTWPLFASGLDWREILQTQSPRFLYLWAP